ncbi:hypothetical protein HS048_08105 [Planomonospora sp. ID91781]|uniref:hypothetical protein n=1 Tax=Planomonospora sp. ID91781 TaxID=2738135 RepID=UPI0018C39F23|nr:hypothetical protein [Planomonospora sp. ID91781]MBG0820695.1 hypothetical protein [Planomonospora sp. ID91781]
MTFTSRFRTSAVAVTLLAVTSVCGGCGAGGATAARICDMAAELHGKVDDVPADVQDRHLGEWHDLIDTAVGADDSGLAAFGEHLDREERQDVSSARVEDLREFACEGEVPRELTSPEP